MFEKCFEEMTRKPGWQESILQTRRAEDDVYKDDFSSDDEKDNFGSVATTFEANNNNIQKTGPAFL